ncbi:MAG TPA: DUF427 domain-containing protein [Marmoricola sp.]|nr:DUF427 domain-containing protein [Marmoricola sp.]
MAVRMADLVHGAVPELRIHPVGRRVRAESDGATVVDSTRAVLVWEPRRVVPSYAVPDGDVAGRLVPFEGTAGAERPVQMGKGAAPVLDPRTPFTVHSCPGRSLSIETSSATLPGAAFAADDPDLDGYVVLDWDAFTRWLEEDQPVMGHPHDPFDRIDCLRSSRHVRLSAGGVALADCRRPTLLFETPLPVRYYVPREDVAFELLEPSALRTVCAYKGRARYWDALVGDKVLRAVAWSYEEPLNDALPVRDLVAFFTERLDLVLDGEPVERPVTPWS